MKKTGILTALLVASSVCAFGQCASAIKDLRDSWVKNWNDKQVDKIIELYAPDATFLSPEGQRITGRDAIRTYFKKLMDSGNVTVTVAGITDRCSAEIGYDSGTWTETIAVGGGGTMGGSGSVKKIVGNYLVVINKATGKWLIVQHASIQQSGG